MGLTGPVDQLVLLGNGGAARAIAEHYAQQKLCQGCHVIRRSPAKDDVWRDSLSQASLQFHDWAASALTEVCRKPGQTLVVQATSAPLAGHDLAEFADALPEFSGGLVDIVYGKPSKLVMAARRLGVPAQDGLPMLIEQARESQQSWWGRAADYDWLLHTVQQSISPS
jgi:shikimate 5-dehydrogenase